uniref:Uncharacterized protein n=1 Tax=Proboscia inermis TaxID=420281 RepID=A0A6T8JTD9_9STRA|mmetsp:Transcript_30407/g.30715  ORF Transcript_30407/g.30715 Transcript_30407/m.30715 type:complete len:108 (+) Transcript_30407:127-450(+)
MLREYPEVTKAIFLHVVSDVTTNPTIPPMKLINGRPVVYFRTYVGAAAKAVQLGLLDEEGLQKVIDAAKLALRGVSKTDDKWENLIKDINNALRILECMKIAVKQNY